MEGQDNPPKKRAALSLAAVPGAAAAVPGGSGDPFSLLPDHLLVRILLKLGTKQAVQTSVLSRQWRRVWAQLPVLEFDGVESSVPALALAAYKAHGERDIHSLTVSPNQVNAQHTTAWMSLAAPLLSGRLRFDNRRLFKWETVQGLSREGEEAMLPREAFQLPCFKKATEILMDLGFLDLALPPAGVFDALRVMRLENFWFPGQISISDTMFPSLQELTIRRVRGLVGLTLESESLLYIHLSHLAQIQRLDILAPELNKLEVTFCFYDVPEPVANIAAERLEELRWEVPCVPKLKKMPHLRVLGAPPITTLWSEHVCAEFLKCFPPVHHLELQISVGVQDSCLPLCICHNEARVWEPKVFPIRFLEKVEIVNFNGALGEVRVVEQLVPRAPRLKILRVTSKVEDDSLDHIKGICPAECNFEIVVVRGQKQRGTGDMVSDLLLQL